MKLASCSVRPLARNFQQKPVQYITSNLPRRCCSLMAKPLRVILEVAIVLVMSVSCCCASNVLRENPHAKYYLVRIAPKMIHPLRIPCERYLADRACQYWLTKVIVHLNAHQFAGQPQPMAFRALHLCRRLVAK